MFDARSWIELGGLLLVFLVVYGQTGLFFCFFIPSGAFMFAAGAMIASGVLNADMLSAFWLFTLAAILGNFTGFFFGYKIGPKLRKRKDSRFFKQTYLDAAEQFFEKYGGRAVLIGFFLPVVRTFAPIVAGMLKMKVKRFSIFTILGAAFWVFSFLLAGYLIGSRPYLRPYMTYILVGVVIIVSIPVVIKVIKSLNAGRKELE